jgi:hypothetical protein
MAAAATAVGSVRAEARIAQLLAAECPMRKEADGRILRPLPSYEFGSAVSWKAASSASMAAFTATA